MYKCLVILSCVALAMGAVRREAPAGDAGANMLAEIQKRAEEFGKTISEQFNAISNSKNTQEVNNALKKGSDDILQQLSTLSGSLQSAISDANGKAKEALEQARTNVEKTVADLRKAHPDVEQKTKELKDKLQTAVQDTNAQAQKLAKEITANLEATNEKLAPKIKQAFEDFTKQAEAVQKQIHDAATKQ